MSRPRLNFTAETKRAALQRSSDLCECHRVPQLGRPEGCGVKLVAGLIRYEHIIQDAIRKDNSLDNAACLTKTCWLEKTCTIDIPVIAKSNRVRDHHWGTETAPRAIIVGSRASDWKHKISGGWERR